MPSNISKPFRTDPADFLSPTKKGHFIQPQLCGGKDEDAPVFPKASQKYSFPATPPNISQTFTPKSAPLNNFETVLTIKHDKTPSTTPSYKHQWCLPFSLILRWRRSKICAGRCCIRGMSGNGQRKRRFVTSG